MSLAGQFVVICVYCLVLLRPMDLRAAEPLKVVASIKPLQGIAAAIMKGAGAPSVLIPGGATPHSYSLKPSQLRALQGADLVIWIGPEFESFLVQSLKSLSTSTHSLAVAGIPGLALLEAREGGVWTEEAGGEGEEQLHRHGTKDLHLWLSLSRTRLVAEVLTARLGEIDPERRGVYLGNLADFSKRLDWLDVEIRHRLSGVHDKPYLVFHDAYQYFENEFGLLPIGAVTVHPDRPPGARRIRELRQEIIRRNAVCVFSEPQFPPRLVATLIEGTPVRSGVLDPLGSALESNAEAYETLMLQLVDGMRQCLGWSGNP